MVWCKAEAGLARSPKLIALSYAMNWSRVEAVGRVVCLWGAVVEHADDGDVSSWPPGYFAEVMSLGPELGEQVVEALVEHGFLDRSPEGLVVHAWEDRYPILASRRRKAKSESKKKSAASRSENVPKTPQERPAHVESRGDKKRRDQKEENAREEEAPGSVAFPVRTPQGDLGYHAIPAEMVARLQRDFSTVDVRSHLDTLSRWFLSHEDRLCSAQSLESTLRRSFMKKANTPKPGKPDAGALTRGDLKAMGTR